MFFTKLFSHKKTQAPPETVEGKLEKLWVYYKDLERFFAKQGYDSDVYKELVIETLCRSACLMTHPKFVEQGKTLNFLYSTAKYVAYDFRKKWQQHIAEVALEQDFEAQNPNYILEPVDFLNECIEKARMEVSPTMKTYVDAFESHYDKKVSYADLAQQLNKSKDYIEKKVGEIRNLIRNCTRKKCEQATIYHP